MIIHGHVPGAGDPAHGGKAAVVTAGRKEVEHGLDRIEGKTTGASAAGHAPARDEQGGVDNGTGAAPSTAPQASTAAPRAEPTSQKARGAAADTRHPVDRGAAATTAAPPHERHIAANGPPGVRRDTDTRRQGNGAVAGDQDNLDKRDRPTAVDGPGAQRDTDVRQQVQGNGQANGTSVRDKQTRTATDASDRANAVPGGYDSPAALGSPGVQGDTDVRQQGNGSASSDRDKAQDTRTTADTSDPLTTAASQEQPSGTAPQA